MRLFSLLFLLGTFSIQFFTVLPDVKLIVLLATSLLTMTLVLRKRSKIFSTFQIAAVALSLGFLAATFTASNLLNNRLPTKLEGVELLLQGRVHDIPNKREDGVRFLFKVDKASIVDDTNTKNQIEVNGIVRLGWFQQIQDVNAGEKWQLKVRLKRPSGFMNPGGFDYEKWLFTERIIATGYIRKSEQLNKRLEAAPWWSANHWRQKIHQNIQDSVSDKSAAAVLSALVVAVRSKLDDQQWQLLQQSGTSHLIAISGLHIAVVAGFAFLPIMLIWRLFPGLNEKVPLPIAGAVLGVIFATIYAVLAGFNLPTQRALLMVIIGMWGLVSRRNYDSFTVLAIALLLVLILDPLAAMTISFWLSFLAVALILIILKRQIQKPHLVIIKLQVILSLAMLPLTLLFFGTASLTSPVANLLAIPWVSLIVVPLSLIALIIMPFSSIVSNGIFNLAAYTIDYLFKGLGILSDSPLGKFNPAEVPPLYLIIAFTGLLFLLLPKGFPARWLGLILMAPAFLFAPDKPQHGEFTYMLLDVGQGMASVIQTAEHTLIYDTGTRVSDSFDIGKLVVVPYLRSKGIDTVDSMIISHEDNDHRGGSKYILQTLNVKEVMRSENSSFTNRVTQTCISGKKWQWDGVDFEVLSPPSKHQLNDNNSSCVIRVSNQHHSLLLTGDIQKKSESYLIKTYNVKLDSDVMTVPHHGSKTSSSTEFINAVSPDIGLIPAGYRSHFGHPNQAIVKRYQAKGIKLLDTVGEGAIQLIFPANENAIATRSYRKENRGFWTR